MSDRKEIFVLVGLRLSMAFIFLWAFFDKLFGLGFATTADKSWIAGNSPTIGFLKFGTHGPFASVYQSLAGNVFVDWIFMLGLLGIGTALLLGIGLRLAAISGSLMLFLMWAAALPPENNPLIDDHIVYIFVLYFLSYTQSGDNFGLGKWWKEREVVKKYPLLE